MPNSSNTIVDQLEEDIVFGRRRPRERLVEDDIVSQFGAKKHIVREALGELERMGLVERIRNKGALVRDYSPDEVRKIYAVRLLLEAEAARQIRLPVSAKYLSELEAVFEEHSKAVDDNDLRQTFRSNIRFHQVLFSACENPYLAEAIEQFALKLHAIRFYSLTNSALLRQSRNNHRQMIDAIRNGNQEELVKICMEHLQPSENAYITAYEKFIRAPQ